MIKELDKHLKRSIKKHNVPGASVAILRGKRIIATAAAGVVNLDTRVPVTTDAVFQIGSITKPMTASMIMQLRDEGKLSLDDFLLKHLPTFRNSDMVRLRKVTLRHLLRHQSGIDGDFFPPTDCGRHAIEELLEKASMLPSLFEPGTNWSYCNIGFSALGRIIEIMDHRSYDESLKARIFKPLGMRHALSRMEDNVRFRVAVGHLPDSRNPKLNRVPAYPFLSIGHKAAGATPAMTASDLIRFAAAHMHGGIGLNGTRLLAKSTAAEMLRPEVRISSNRKPGQVSFGLAWILDNWNGIKIFAHDGGTLGQYSQLVVCPEKRIAVAVLTNGGNAQGLFTDITATLLASLGKIKVRGLPEPGDQVAVKPHELVGEYENILTRVEVFAKKGDIYARSSNKEGVGAPQTEMLRFVDPRLARVPIGLLAFEGPRGKKATALRAGSRLLLRTGG